MSIVRWLGEQIPKLVPAQVSCTAAVEGHLGERFAQVDFAWTNPCVWLLEHSSNRRLSA